MKISIIIPVYNVYPYIRECFDSLAHEDYKDVEFLVIDDGSTDGSGAVCDEYASRDSRFIVKHTKNGGVSQARNEGLSMVSADSDYVSFIDPDDYIRMGVGYISLINRQLAKKEPDILFVSYATLKSDELKINHLPKDFTQNKIDTKEIFEAAVFGLKNNSKQFISCSLFSQFVRTSLIKNLNIQFDTYIYKAEDWIFTAQLIPECKSFDFLDVAYYTYRIRPGSLITTKKDVTIEGIKKSFYILSKIEEAAKRIVDFDCAKLNSIMAMRYLMSRINIYRSLVDYNCNIVKSYQKYRRLVILDKDDIFKTIDKRISKIKIRKCGGIRGKVEAVIAKYKLHFIGLVYSLAIKTLKSQ